MVVNFYDTSALMLLNEFFAGLTIVSPFVLAELEQIKTSKNKDERQKALARKALKNISLSSYTHFSFPSEKEIQKIITKSGFLFNITDHKILADAVINKRKNYKNDELKFVTADLGLANFAARFKEIKVIFLSEEEEKTVLWEGCQKFTPDENTMAKLYSNPEENILKAKINEYCEIYEGTELKDILRWNGERYAKLKYNNFKNQFLNLNIKPRNVRQKMAFDLLQNNDITVKLLTGVPGGGKDFIMLNCALDAINKGIFDKIIYVRNLVPFKDAPEIGFLAGSLEEKISWGLGPIRSILGEEGLAQFENEGIIEAVNLGFLRGCSFDRACIYVSEGQNITGGGYKLLVSRCGEGSQLWVNGDFTQTDSKDFEENNGIIRLSNSLKGNPLFGCVNLLETERSKTAELAAII